VFGVLLNRRFAALFASQVSSLVATGLLTVALALVAVRLDPGAAAGIIGTALTIRIAVYVIVSPLASALLAGRSSRAVLVGADLVRLIVAGALVFATAPWQLYVGIVLLQTASAVFTPTYQAVIPRNVSLAEAPSYGRPGILYNVASAGSQAYVNLAKEFIRHGEKSPR